jgi:two-component system, cell cycle sensor histidine kinase and response regulator CckA
MLAKLQRAVSIDGQSQFSAINVTTGAPPLPKDGHSTTAKPLRGTVLVVDDDEMVLEATQAAFKHAGFSTLTAKDGEDAIRRYQEHQDQIDCVFLDLTLPKMSGEVVFRRLRQICPEVRIIVTSGHSAEELEKRFAGLDVFAFVCKPKSSCDAIAKLQMALGGR